MFNFLSVNVPNWTTPYDMQSTVLSSGTMSILWDSLFTSIKSMGSTGIIIFGVVSSIFLVVSIVKTVFLRNVKFKNAVQNREFNREVHIADMQKNASSIIEEKNMARGISLDADIIFKTNNMDKIVEGKLLDREISSRANRASAKKYYSRRGQQ